MPREAARDSGRWVAKVRLEIERMAYGADAIARDEAGKTVFVAGGVPGDVVEAEVTSEASSYSRARVTEVLEPSADRVRPACPYADVCGGCPWAHMAYDAQARAKREGVVDALMPTRSSLMPCEFARYVSAPDTALGIFWNFLSRRAQAPTFTTPASPAPCMPMVTRLGPRSNASSILLR